MNFFTLLPEEIASAIFQRLSLNAWFAMRGTCTDAKRICEDSQILERAFSTTTPISRLKWYLCQLYADKILHLTEMETWYFFENHRWMPLLSSKAKVGRRIALFFAVYRRLSELLKRWGLEKQAKRYLNFSTQAQNLLDYRTVREWEQYARDPHFLASKNVNGSLLGCENGVLDLEKGVFRDGRPEDYITQSCGLNFREYHEEDPEVQEFDAFLFKIYTEEDQRERLLDFLTECLWWNPETGARVLYLIGDGSNGKTVIRRVIGKTFGDYCKPIRSLVLDSFLNPRFTAGIRVVCYESVEMCVEEPCFEDEEVTAFLSESDVHKVVHKSHFWETDSHWILSLEEQLSAKMFSVDYSIRDKYPSFASVLLWKLFERAKIRINTKRESISA